MTSSTAPFVGLLVLASAATAAAQPAASPPPPLPSQAGTEEPVLGLPGQKLVTGDFAIEASGSWGDRSVRLRLAPALDVFVTRRLTVGGQLLLDLAHSGSGEFSSYGGAVRVGFYRALGGRWGGWGRTDVGYRQQTDSSGGGIKVVSMRGSGLWLFHLAPHVFVGGGVFYESRLNLSTNSDHGEAGLVSVVGGWW